MHDGKIDTLDDKRKVFKHPKTLAAMILTGCKNISPARKIAADKLFAADWNLTLTAPNIPDDLKFVGIRAHDLELCSERGENIFAVEVVQVIEDTSSYIVMVRADGGKSIRFEVDKKSFIPNSKFITHCALRITHCLFASG